MSLAFWNKESPKELDIHIQNICSILEIKKTYDIKKIGRGITKKAYNLNIMASICDLLGVDHMGLINESLENLKARLGK